MSFFVHKEHRKLQRGGVCVFVHFWHVLAIRVHFHCSHGFAHDVAFFANLSMFGCFL